jgi:4-hydroxybenzoyl-CoA thioesterase
MNQFDFTVRWKDCDQAGIVFYPRYLEYMNDATHELMENAGYVFDAADPSGKGVFPMVALNVTYLASMRLGDKGVIESRVISIGRTSLKIRHQIFCNGRAMVEAQETRVFASRGSDGVLKGQPVPDALRKAALSD